MLLVVIDTFTVISDKTFFLDIDSKETVALFHFSLKEIIENHCMVTTAWKVLKFSPIRHSCKIWLCYKSKIERIENKNKKYSLAIICLE